VTINLLAGLGFTVDGSIESLISIENAIGSNQNDTLFGSLEGSMLNGGDGDDSLVGFFNADLLIDGLGDDTVVGGFGDDIFRHVGGTAIFDGGDGEDTMDLSLMTEGVAVSQFLGLVRTDWTSPSERVDVVTFENTENVFGDDTVSGFGGVDTLLGGDGYDWLDLSTYFHIGGNTVSLTDGTLEDSFGARSLISGFEAVIGSNFGDVLDGDSRDNTFIGGAGADIIRGGDGTDTASYDIIGDTGVVVILGASAQDGFGGTDTLFSIENVTGSDLDDLIQGDEGNNEISGGAGSDTLSGGNGGYDVITTGLGNDVVSVERNGGTTRVTDFDIALDRLDLSNLLFTETVRALDEATETETGLLITFADSTSISLDSVFLSDFNSIQIDLPTEDLPVIAAIAPGSSVFGSDDSEFLVGLEGNETLEGGGGADILEGGAGDDFLKGGIGLDIASYQSATVGGVFVDLELGTATGAGGNDSLEGIEGAR